METAFLLGAGASAEADLPLARQLTAQVVDGMQAARGSSNTRALNFVIGSMIAFDSKSGLRPDELPDIERVVSAVELLANRQVLEVTPFVESWDPTVATLEQPRPTTDARAVQEIAEGLGVPKRQARGAATLGPINLSKVSRALEKLIDGRIGRRPTQAFSALHRQLIQDLVRLLAIPEDRHLSYLAPLLAMTATSGVIGTLNYDVTLETQAARVGIDLSVGIDSWSSEGVLSWPINQGRLYKLHGSVDWIREQTYGDAELRVSRETLSRRDGQSQSGYMPFVIYGQREKLRPTGPFLQLLEGFRQEIAKCDQLAVVGYSFLDPHINEVVAQWVNSKLERRLLIIDPYFPPDDQLYGNDFRTSMIRGLRRQANPRPGSTELIPAKSRVAICRKPASEAFTAMQESGPSALIDATLTTEGFDPEGN